jgi:hypothetical protein
MPGGDSSDGVRNLVLVCVLPIVGGLAIIVSCYFLLVRRNQCANQASKSFEVKDTRHPANFDRVTPSAASGVQSKEKEPTPIQFQMASLQEETLPDKAQVSIAKNILTATGEG